MVVQLTTNYSLFIFSALISEDREGKDIEFDSMPS